jgi:hypothetical protein
MQMAAPTSWPCGVLTKMADPSAAIKEGADMVNLGNLVSVRRKSFYSGIIAASHSYLLHIDEHTIITLANGVTWTLYISWFSPVLAALRLCPVKAKPNKRQQFKAPSIVQAPHIHLDLPWVVEMSRDRLALCFVATANDQGASSLHPGSMIV